MNELRVKSKKYSMRMYEEEARKQVVDINSFNKVMKE